MKEIKIIEREHVNIYNLSSKERAIALSVYEGEVFDKQEIDAFIDMIDAQVEFENYIRADDIPTLLRKMATRPPNYYFTKNPLYLLTRSYSERPPIAAVDIRPFPESQVIETSNQTDTIVQTAENQIVKVVGVAVTQDHTPRMSIFANSTRLAYMYAESRVCEIEQRAVFSTQNSIESITRMYFSYVRSLLRFMMQTQAAAILIANPPQMFENVPAVYIPDAHKDSEPIPQNIAPLLKFLLSARHIELGANHLAYKLYTRGYLQVYETFMQVGADSKYAQKFLRDEEFKYKYLKFLELANQKKRVAMKKFRHILNIIDEKLSAARSEKIQEQAKLQSFVNVDAFLEKVLTAAERKLVETEYKRQLNYWKAVASNKCEHVALYLRLRRITDDRQVSKIYDELTKFYDKPIADNYIPCRVCKLGIICPHEDELIKYNLASSKTRKFDQVKFYSIISKFLAQSGGEHSHKCCKICGEVIYGAESRISKAEKGALKYGFVDQLHDFLWGECMQLMQYVRIKQMINEKDFVNDMVSACYNHISEIETKLKKSATNTDADIKNIKKFYAALYGFAYFINFIKTTGFGKVMVFSNIDAAKGKTPMLKNINAALELIRTRRSYLIAGIPGMTNDWIMAKMVEAIKKIGDSFTVMPGTIVDIRDITWNIITSDPFFRYVIFINTIADKTKYKTEADRIQAYLGKKIDNIGKSAKLYDQISIPAMSTWKTAKERYVAQCFLYVCGKSLGVKKLENPDEMWKLDREIKRKNAENNILFSCSIGMHAQKFAYKLAPLAAVYDEKGDKHRWTIFIYQDGQKVTKKQITQMLLEGKKLDTAKFADIECSVCGHLQSKVDAELNDAKIRKVLEENFTYTNFFKFYENKCPEGNLHEYTSGKCKKCGKLKDNQDDPAYFVKYADKYRTEIKSDAVVVSLLEKERELPPAAPSPTAEISKWKYDASIAKRLADTFSIKINLLFQLGNTYGYEYADILAGKVQPHIAGNKWDNRIQLLASYMYEIISYYNEFKYYNGLDTSNIEIRNFIKRERFPIENILGLRALPDLFTSWPASYNYAFINFAPDSLCEYLLESVMQAILSIYEIKTENYIKQLVAAFAKFLLERILLNDEMASIAEPIIFSEEMVDQATDIDLGNDEVIGSTDDKYGVDPSDYTVDINYEEIDYDGSNDKDSEVGD